MMEVTYRVRGCTHPRLAKCVGYSSDGPVYRQVPPSDMSQLSGSGRSGKLTWHIGDGLFAVDLPDGRGRLSRDYFCVTGDELLDLSREDAVARAATFFPLEYKAASDASRAARNKELALAEADLQLRDLFPTPEAIGSRHGECVVEVERLVTYSPEATIEQLVESARVTYRTFLRGSLSATSLDQLEAAIERRCAEIDEIERERAEAREVAKAQAKAAGLPKLVGSKKQIAWALEIRARCAVRSPAHPSLQRETEARYWIDRRAEFLR